MWLTDENYLSRFFGYLLLSFNFEFFVVMALESLQQRYYRLYTMKSKLKTHSKQIEKKDTIIFNYNAPQ